MKMYRIYPAKFYRLTLFCLVVMGLLMKSGCEVKSRQEYSHHDVIPLPKETLLEDKFLSFTDTLFLFVEDQVLAALLPVLHDEFKSMFNTEIVKTSEKSRANFLLISDGSMEDEAYLIEVKDRITITGGSYRAVAMGTVSVLQLISEKGNSWYIPEGTVYDYPDMPFRGVMIDVARKKHSIEVLKQIVSLCRWYKVNYLQLHLTDEHYFSFPSDAFPQLSTENYHFTKEELIGLVRFAHARGVEIIPELEVPGHAGQFVEQMPEIFGFENEKLNRYTINMANDRIYPVLDSLIGEIASVFNTSEYIHIGGDEADFSGMDQEPEVQKYLKEKGLRSVEELFWHFINRMNEMVQMRNRKAIVWEGFSKTANDVVSKDITVMAWETMYQLPDDLLEAGYNIINVSWKPLYVVNNRKWNPGEIYDWNVYQWQNWFPKAPSYNTIQIEEHTNVLGACMASWDQPEFVEISSLRKRLPAMVERVWNIKNRKSSKVFLASVDNLDQKLDSYFSPVKIQEYGLRFPEIRDGFRHEQVWFGDTLTINLTAPAERIIRYSLDEPLSDESSVFNDPVKISETTTFRYRAYDPDGQPIGHEVVKYYELHPLKVSFEGSHLFTEEEYWDRVESWKFPYSDSLTIAISSLRPGTIKYTLNSLPDSEFQEYNGTFTITEDIVVTAGLFVNDSLTGELWRQQFTNKNNN